MLKEKEAKETKTLEDMVQKVEENLVTATVSWSYNAMYTLIKNRLVTRIVFCDLVSF